LKFEKLLIIPDRGEIDKYEALACKENLGFEYNDFFMPTVLENRDEVEKVVNIYKESRELPRYTTSHGAFLDVTVFSDDPLIAKVSDYRVEQSIDIARKLGSEKVIFHTNYVANFTLPSYRRDWVERNAEYWNKKLDKYKDIQICIENMFDDTPELLSRLGEKMKNREGFGICFDYAHAHVFGHEKDILSWVEALAPYTKHIHINDNDFKNDLHMAVGEGKIDWNRFKACYDKYFAGASVLIEVKGFDRIMSSLDFLREL